MPSPSNFSLSRWIGLCELQNTSHESSDQSGNTSEDNPISNTIECYACTQVGVPVFHSTSCDHAHQPEWEASAGTSLVPIQARTGQKKTQPTTPRRPSGPFGRVLDPRTKRVQKWNRFFLLARGMALAIDPLFFYALSIGRGGSPCLYMDGALAAIVTVLRTCVDAVHLFHLWLQFRLAYVSRESLVVGCGCWRVLVCPGNTARSLMPPAAVCEGCELQPHFVLL
ncbi:putative Cyclic nucleotide-gated ion channel [Corchorus olitorius]|uniref:Cyclic nucleotide-gated ion channel n=1 Tax=Corchorus olitorius TaxID=93759 RepID=A0A1R3KJP7_9ROSI|nr:putative Cyclic nucleotide-gated ion channel [Corchorus olitorius]